MGVPSMLPTIKSLGLSMPFLKVFGVKPLFQKGLAGVRGRAPRSPVPHKLQFYAFAALSMMEMPAEVPRREAPASMRAAASA